MIDRLQTKLLEVNTEEMIPVLLRNDEAGFMNAISPSRDSKLVKLPSLKRDISNVARL
jgi:hypothetical protein